MYVLYTVASFLFLFRRFPPIVAVNHFQWQQQPIPTVLKPTQKHLQVSLEQTTLEMGESTQFQSVVLSLTEKL